MGIYHKGDSYKLPKWTSKPKTDRYAHIDFMKGNDNWSLVANEGEVAYNNVKRMVEGHYNEKYLMEEINRDDEKQKNGFKYEPIKDEFVEVKAVEDKPLKDDRKQKNRFKYEPYKYK